MLIKTSLCLSDVLNSVETDCVSSTVVHLKLRFFNDVTRKCFIFQLEHDGEKS